MCFRPVVRPFVVSCQSPHVQSFQLPPACSQLFAWYLPEFLRLLSSLFMWVICYTVHSTTESALPSQQLFATDGWRLSLCVWPQSVMSHPPRPGEALNQCGSCGSSQTHQSSSYLQGCGVTASFMRWHCLELADLTSLSPPSVYSQEIWPSHSRGKAGTCRE